MGLQGLRLAAVILTTVLEPYLLRVTRLHRCHEEICVVYAYLHFFLSQSNAADYTGSRCFVRFWVPSVLCLEYRIVLRTIYPFSTCQRGV